MCSGIKRNSIKGSNTTCPKGLVYKFLLIFDSQISLACFNFDFVNPSINLTIDPNTSFYSSFKHEVIKSVHFEIRLINLYQNKFR